MSKFVIYYVRDKTDVDEYGPTTRIDYVDFYATRELAQADADQKNQGYRKWFEASEDKRLAKIQWENSKALALEVAGYGRAFLRVTTRQNFVPSYIVDEIEVQS